MSKLNACISGQLIVDFCKTRRLANGNLLAIPLAGLEIEWFAGCINLFNMLLFSSISSKYQKRYNATDTRKDVSIFDEARNLGCTHNSTAPKTAAATASGPLNVASSAALPPSFIPVLTPSFTKVPNPLGLWLDLLLLQPKAVASHLEDGVTRGVYALELLDGLEDPEGFFTSAPWALAIVAARVTKTMNHRRV